MKKSTKIVLNLILTLILILLGSTTVKAGYMGDVNYDGVVDSDDSRQILRYSVGSQYFTNTQRLHADMDRDGIITAADARLALRTSVGYEDLKFRSNKGKVFRIYKQDDYKYKNAPYPARGAYATIGANGCGPACCCIIGSAYGYNSTPGGLVCGGANYSKYDTIQKYFKNRGFTVEFPCYLADKDIKSKLSAGYQIVLLSQGGNIGNYYYGGNHWITLLDINSSGQVFIGDPLTKGGGWFNLNQISSKTNIICVKK